MRNAGRQAGRSPPPARAAGATLPPRSDALALPQRVLVLGYLLAGAAYLAWRVGTLNPDAPLFSALVLAAEGLGYAGFAAFAFCTWKLTVRTPAPPAPDMLVDVIVSATDEPLATVRRTLVAARRMSYPHATWLLDHGNRPELAELAAELEVIHIDRTAAQKAGDTPLAHALRLARGSALAVFTADHTPTKDFLAHTLGYLRDPAVGFVASPAEVYNVDSFEFQPAHRDGALHGERALHNRVIQRGLDHRGATTAAGSGVLLRRRALDAVGGIGAVTGGEDLDLTLRFHRRGWRGVYHAAPLAYGRGADGLAPFVSERTTQSRRALGALRRHRLVLLASGLTAAQRFCHLRSALSHLDGWRKAVLYATPALALLLDEAPMAVLSPATLAPVALHYLLRWAALAEAMRGHGRVWELERLSLARLPASLLALQGLFARRPDARRAPATRARPRGPDLHLAPPAGVLALNALAFPAALAMGGATSPGLGSAAFGASVAWAGANALLARTVIAVARRSRRCRRSEYRFPIAFPALMNHRGARLCAGTIDNLSATGFCYYGLLPRRLDAGEFVSGQVLLPAGPRGFLAEVRRVIHGPGETTPRGVGCTFIWPAPAAGDDLMTLVYGSDLQWRLGNGLGRSLTPLERLARLVRRRTSPDPAAPRLWASAMSQTLIGDATHPGLISVTPAGRREQTLIVFRRLLAKLPLRLTVITRAGLRHVNGDAELFDAFRADGAPLYRYRFRAYDNPLGAPRPPVSTPAPRRGTKPRRRAG